MFSLFPSLAVPALVAMASQSVRSVDEMTTRFPTSRSPIPKSAAHRMVSSQIALISSPRRFGSEPGLSLVVHTNNLVPGVRIKTVSGATGSVSGVTYKDITLSGITKYGVVIEQDYENGDPTGTPTAGVPITNLTLDSVTGTAASGADNGMFPKQSRLLTCSCEIVVYILCASGACSDWTWTGVSVTGGATDSKCENVPTGATC